MDDHAPSDGEDRALSVRLDVHLDREPICGRLSADGGVDEPFVGWLGFADALRRVREQQAQPGHGRGS
jgi:hypothetical protein